MEGGQSGGRAVRLDGGTPAERISGTCQMLNRLSSGFRGGDEDAAGGKANGFPQGPRQAGGFGAHQAEQGYLQRNGVRIPGQAGGQLKSAFRNEPLPTSSKLEFPLGLVILIVK